ncbi:unnamed protein product [Haemonchus placei]|uniref:Uncharacterized protein n=1 Tax=Haemonchus placei TaxID=6290 RepID=A0A0N4VWB0_HAEPC|nr:unnamed protein product [Haemonchus placei]
MDSTADNADILERSFDDFVLVIYAENLYETMEEGFVSAAVWDQETLTQMTPTNLIAILTKKITSRLTRCTF